MEVLENSLETEDERTRYLTQVARAEQLQEVTLPLARITTCGQLTIEILQSIYPGRDGHMEAVYGPPDAKLLAQKGTSTAFILLALLASQPECFATKDWLSEKLGHLRDVEDEDEEENREESDGLKRVDNVVSRLRHLLYPTRPNAPPETRLLRRRLAEYQRASGESGAGYRLAGLPLVWLDVAEIAAHIKRARRLEQFGADGLAEWQAAYALAMGGRFLPGEAYSDWAEWRRQEIETHLWDCVQVLWHHSVEQGEAGETEALRLLRDYWHSHVTQEDALRPLLELLGKRECFGQAEDYYRQLCAALALEGRQPDQRTQDIVDFQQAVQIQRKQTSIDRGKERANVYPTPASLASQQPDPSSDFSHVVTQDTLEAIHELERVAYLDPSRRDFLQSILRVARTAAILPPHSSVALETSFLYDPAQASCPDEAIPETLEHFAKLTKTCRHLSEGNELQTAERLLWSYLPRLETITKLSFTHEQAAAEVASQSYLLAASLAGHRNDLRARHHLSEQALLYGKLAQDRNLQVVALRQLAITFDYLGHPDNVLRIYQRTVPYLDEVSPLLRACIYADISGAYTQLQRQQEAERYLGMAYEYFPENTTHEPDYLSTICRYSTLVLCEGLNHLAFGQAHEAEKVFARIDGRRPKRAMPERIRIDLLNCQVETFIALSKRDQACTYLEISTQAALAIGSTRRFQEASLLLQLMQNAWPHEQRVRQLADLFMR